MPKSETSTQRYWLLDWFGRLVDHDVLRDCLHLTEPSSERAPGVYFRAETTLPGAFTVNLEKHVSLPMPLPELHAQRRARAAISLERSDGFETRYMRALPDKTLDFAAKIANEWEQFFPLPEKFVYAYSILSREGAVTLSNAAGTLTSPMQLRGEHKFGFGPMEFPLYGNIDTIAGLAQFLPLQDMRSIALSDHNGTIHEITVAGRK